MSEDTKQKTRQKDFSGGPLGLMETWLFHVPTQVFSHRFNLIFAFLLLSTLLMILYSIGLISPSLPAIADGEMDLSGTWKIKYSDSARFSDPKLSDSDWCEIGVPNPTGHTKSANPLGCSKSTYPTELMRNKTYWYRKEVIISSVANWKEPSIFLGYVKGKIWVYWDGELVTLNNAADGRDAVSVHLSQPQVAPGRHVLAVRVQSGDVKYPGIYHASPRRITLGEFSGDRRQSVRLINQRYVLPTFTIFVQTAGLALTLLLLCMGRGATAEFLWLGVYFFGSTLRSISPLVETDARVLLKLISFNLVSFGTLGFALRYSNWLKSENLAASRALMAFGITTTAVYMALFYMGYRLGTLANVLNLSSSLAPFLALSAFGAIQIFSDKDKQQKLNWVDKASLGTLVLLLSHTVVSEFFLRSVPSTLTHPSVQAILSIALLATMIYQYTIQERKLAFYGRFIRPGLRKLLSEQIASAQIQDAKMFRPRKIAVMKIDIVGHTETTFQMPYGIKRLFQDTWFSVIDEIVANHVFMDKNVGDGSIYCFSENDIRGSCMVALMSALEIRDRGVKLFDQTFNRSLREFLEATPELQNPANIYFQNFTRRTGINFWERTTSIRIGLAYGYVDEGLWGLSTQSHYDVQGDLISLAARVESKAIPSEILMDSAFFAEISRRSDRVNVIPRQEILKGIGEVTLYSFVSEETLKKVS